MGCGSSVELFDKSAYTSIPGTPQPEHRMDRNKNTIEDDKTLRGDVIQKQYARKIREEKLKMMDKRRSSAAKEISDHAMEDRDRFSLSSRYGSRATSRTGSPLIRVTPLAMANGMTTPQQDEVRSAGLVKKLSDLNEATSDSIELRRVSKTADLKAGAEEGTADGGKGIEVAEETGGVLSHEATGRVSEFDDKENRLMGGDGVDVESTGAKKGKGKGKRGSRKDENRGSVSDGKREKRKAGGTGEKRTAGEVGAKNGDGSDRLDNVTVNHPHAVHTDTDMTAGRVGFEGRIDLTLKNQDGDSSEKEDGGTKHEKEPKTLDNNDVMGEKLVLNKRSERKKRKTHTVNGENKKGENVMNGPKDENLVAGNTIETSSVDEMRKSFTKPEIRVSNGETFNSNNNATDLSTCDHGSHLDIGAGSDLDLMAPTLPSFSAGKAIGAKKGKPSKKTLTSKRKSMVGKVLRNLGIKIGDSG